MLNAASYYLQPELGVGLFQGKGPDSLQGHARK